ncbi:MiaB/RimO family radical SAM methylthiotransferase [Lachnospiraceae bacterium C1.1]|nr:MiaB/RimO family radical SAM methylthiotransferase [Lachnospiraceae bacterium C1.1]
MKTAALHNLGCKVNAYEMDIMQKALSEDGYKIVPFDEKADIYVINTCSVTNIADRKSRQMLHKARQKNPNAIVIAAGCYVNTRQKEDVLNEGVDIVIGNKEKAEIAKITDKYISDHPDINNYDSIEDFSENDSSPIKKRHSEIEGNHTRAFIKIQDGCEMYCSYCIIPYAREEIRSRNEQEALDEIESLSHEGYSEFVITGIHLSSYGIDRLPSPSSAERHMNFAEFISEYHSGRLKAPLIDFLKKTAEIEGVKRIRLGSLEPRIVTEDFARELSAIPKICPHFHLSLQSGSDTVLKRMNRHYSLAEYSQGVDILRKYFDHPAITTDIIVGFPAETDEEFDETVRFVEDINFYETHIFKYSRRHGTPADRMSSQLTDAEKHKRSLVLQDLNSKHKSEFMDNAIGREVEVLFEEDSSGYSKEYIRVCSPDKVYAPGTIVKGVISGRYDDEQMLFLETL